jgi:hypothetical protein
LLCSASQRLPLLEGQVDTAAAFALWAQDGVPALNVVQRVITRIELLSRRIMLRREANVEFEIRRPS